jgi:hypothetical protein
MPEESEIETKDLQEAISELHHEREEREAEAKSSSWTRYVALTTAILAVFAAVGALESGGLVNEAMMAQLRASDTWNEYQASKQKMHVYTVQANALLDAGAALAAPSTRPATDKTAWSAEPPGRRASEYVSKVDDEATKADQLKKRADKWEKTSDGLMERHHAFARSVAFIQIAIALGAVAALTRVKWIWLVSLAAGVIGIAMLCAGFWP